MTTLFFAGAEQASHRNLLTDCGVSRFGINVTNINRLVKPGWDVRAHLPDGAEWVLYADKESTWEQAAPYVAQRPTLIVGPVSWAEHFGSGDSFAPFWEEGLEGSWGVLGLTDATVKNQAVLRKILATYQDTMLVAVTGASRAVHRLDALVSNAWWGAQAHGETQVWTGTRLARYSGNRKAEVRPKHRADIERLEVSYDRVLADDPVETARLAIVSWQHWEARHDRSNVVPLPSNEQYSDQEGMGSAHTTLGNGNGRTGHAVRLVTQRDRMLLPGLGQEAVEEKLIEEDGSETVQTTMTMRTIEDSMRRCDACYLSPNCPAAMPHASCAYKIPVVIKTKDQLQALMRTVIEVQGQRVMFARFAEEIEGQGIDASLSNEIDRLFDIMKTAKDINDTRDVFRLEMEAKGNSGMISRLFGSQAGDAARALSVPVGSTQVMRTLDDEH